MASRIRETVVVVSRFILHVDLSFPYLFFKNNFQKKKELQSEGKGSLFLITYKIPFETPLHDEL